MQSSSESSSTPSSSSIQTPRGSNKPYFQFPAVAANEIFKMETDSQESENPMPDSGGLNEIVNPNAFGDFFANLSNQAVNFPVQGMYQPPADAMGRPMGWPLGPHPDLPVSFTFYL